MHHMSNIGVQKVRWHHSTNFVKCVTSSIFSIVAAQCPVPTAQCPLLGYAKRLRRIKKKKSEEIISIESSLAD